MSPRKTFLAALVFLALVSLYYTDARRLEYRRVAREQSERLFSFDLAHIQRVHLVNEHGDFVIERRGVNEWWITQPIETKADTDQVEPLLRNLQGAKKRNAFVPEGDLAPYGLDDPPVRVELAARTNGDTRTVTILYGDTAHQTYQVYARIEGEPEIFTLSDYSRNQCLKTLYNLRDKSILAAAPGNVRSVKISLNDRTYALERSAPDTDDWTLQPAGAAADPQAVNTLLTALDNARAVHIVDSPTTPPAALHTTADTARAVVRVSRFPSEDQPTSPTEQTVYIGSTTPEADGLYTRLEGRDRVSVVRESLLTELDKHPYHFRAKELVNVDPADVAFLSIRGKSRSVAVGRPSTDADWTFASPPDEPVSKKKMARLLSDLTNDRAKTFLAEPGDFTPERLREWGLDEPSLRVRLSTFDDPTTCGFDIGETNAEEGVVYLHRLADRAVLALDFKRLSDFYKFRDDLVDRTFLHFNPDDVHRVRIELRTSQGPLAYPFTRRAHSWVAETAQGRRVTIQPYDVQAFLQSLQDLEYASVHTPDPEDETRGGLENPAIQIDLLDKDDQLLSRLTVGNRLGYRQIVGSGRNAYVIDLTQTEQLTRDLENLLTRVEQSPPEDVLTGHPASP